MVFNGPTNTSVKGQVTLNNITLKNLNAPLSFGDGTITFNAHSVINIAESITNGNPITLVSSSKEIEYNNAFSKNLWQLINYQGHGASSEKLVSSAGNGVYDVVYSFNNQTYNFQEVFHKTAFLSGVWALTWCLIMWIWKNRIIYIIKTLSVL